MTDALTAKLLASLKRHNPAKVRAYAGDDDSRDIAVPTRRRRWSQVIEAIEARSWSRVEMLDKAGAVLGYVEHTDAAGEVETLAQGKPTAINEARAIVELVLKGQKEAMAFRDSEVKELLAAQGSVVREVVAAMNALTAMYREQVDAGMEVAAMRATADAGSGGQLKELIDAAPTLLQMLPMLKGLLGGPEVPTNGARKPA